jgi:general secretion pathway protein D
LEESARAAADRERQEQLGRQQAISSLITDSRRLTEQGKYEEALQTVNQILTIDPNNDYARGVRQILFDRASLNKQKLLRQTYVEQWIKTYDNLDESKIPYSDILTYPADWPDLSARREQTVREERAITAADEAVAGLLEKSLPEIRFQDVAFADVVDFLRDTTQANIFVNWKALEAANIDRNAPVSTRLRNVKFSKVLRTILESVGGGATTSQLGYTVDEGVITISTTEDLARNVETRTYDIRDLIIAIPDFSNAPDFSLTGNGNNGNNGGGGFGGGSGNSGRGGGLFGGGSGDDDDDDDDENTPTREELVEQITSLIRETIGVGTWKEDGGQLGSLRELGGQLIVTQTPEVHRQISSLLEKLREQRSIQVMVEARFLTVQRNFLEDIGVDFDFYMNNDGNVFTGLIPGTSPLPIGIDGKQQTGVGPIAVANNTANFTTAGGLGTGINGNLAGSFATPNLSTTINMFLDDFQASLLIRATQGNQNITQLTAPRVTLFNGQRAYVLVARQIAYVSDLTPVVGTDAQGYDPTVDVIQSGVVLDVAATVSADRKYVTLTLRPQLSRIIGIQTFPVFGGTTGGDDDDDDDDTGGGGATSNVGFIQQPEIEITEVRTSVSVPDGGTLLLGGTTVSGEIERESGVPVLSKVPFLKRAFTNRGYARDESVLLIMVKPTIIIQREIEQQNFPLLTSRAN